MDNIKDGLYQEGEDFVEYKNGEVVKRILSPVGCSSLSFGEAEVISLPISFNVEVKDDWEFIKKEEAMKDDRNPRNKQG